MNKSRGFSLLEILIAFAIMAISLTILLKIFSTGVGTAMLAEDYNNAVQLGEGLMAKVGTELPVQAGINTGEQAKYHWTITITPHRLPITNVNTKNLSAELYKVTIKVMWDDDFFQQRLFELVTLKLVNKSL
jgi:general secretion pathway protein I